jgi:peroxiredoxin
MKTKLLLALLVLSQFFLSCTTNKSQNSFVLNGTIKGEIPEYLFLHYGTVTDSVLVDNGQFHFKGKVNAPSNAHFTMKGISVMTNDCFFIENNNMLMNVNVEKKSMKGYDINFISIDSISGSITELTRKDFEVYESTHNMDADWNSKLFKKLDTIITNNPSNNYSSYVFLIQLRKEILNKNQVEKLYHKIDTSALSIVQLEELNRIINPSQNLEVGRQLMDFSLPNTKKELISTKDFRGKVFLIDFWASWCAPCRRQNPDLLKIYEEFKNNDFEILGVSIDKDLDKWMSAVIKDELVWENVIDTRGQESEILVKYGATNSVPQNFLIDKNGVIIAKNISIIDLKKYLQNNN